MRPRPCVPMPRVQAAPLRFVSFSVVLVTLAFFGVVLAGHEEPCKTRWEKAEAQREHARLAQAGIRAVTVWKHAVDHGSVGTQTTRSLRQEYDGHGRLISISAFAADAMSESAVYSYNPDGDMITDVDLDARGAVTESNVFTYDDSARVVAGYSHDVGGRPIGRFEHRFDRERHRITFVKFAPGGVVDYTIEYAFAGDFDAGDYVAAVKKTAGTTPVLRVEKTLDRAGRTTEKKVFQLDKANAYSFQYRYDDRGVLTEVTRVAANGRVETTTRYAIDADGLRAEARETNADGVLTAVSSYQYERGTSTR